MPVKILQPYEGTIPCRVVSPRRKASRFEFTGRLKSPCPPCACVSSFHVPWLSPAAQSVNMSVKACLSFCVGPVIDRLAPYE